MSMTLLLWKAPIVREPEAAETLLSPWYEHNDDSAFEPSADVAAVRGKLRARYPDAPAEGGDDSAGETASLTAVDWSQAIAMVLVLAVLTWGAWWLPIGRWRCYLWPQARSSPVPRYWSSTRWSRRVARSSSCGRRGVESLRYRPFAMTKCYTNNT